MERRARAGVQAEAALVLVAKAAQEQEMSQTVIRLRVDGISFRGAAAEDGICAREVQNTLPADTETVRAFDGHGQPDKVDVAESVIEGNAGGRGVHVLAADSRQRITNQVVPARGGLVLERQAEIAVLVAQEGIVGNADKLDLVGLAHGRRSVAAGETQLGRRVQRQPEVRNPGAVMKSVVGKTVAGIEARELAQVIQPPESSAQGAIVMQAVEISRVEGVVDLRPRRC